MKAVGSVALVLLVAAGCIRVDGEIVIEDDGSGSVEWITAIDSESVLAVFAQEFGDEGGPGGTDEICDGFTEELGTDGGVAGATAEPYEENGFCGARITYDLAASTDHSAAIADLFEGDARLFKQGENWIFEANVDLSDIEDETLGGPDAFGDLLDDASFEIVVDLPGRAAENQNNATKVGDNGRFEWNIDFANPPDRLFAQTVPGSGGGDGGGGGGLGLILVIVAVLALLGAAAWWFLTQRGDSGDSPAPAMASPQPFGQPPVGQPPVATPPVASEPVMPINPANPAHQATVAMNVGDAEAAIQGATASAEPVFDEVLNAWVIDDPDRGRLVHDPATDTWNPA